MALKTPSSKHHIFKFLQPCCKEILSNSTLKDSSLPPTIKDFIAGEMLNFLPEKLVEKLLVYMVEKIWCCEEAYDAKYEDEDVRRDLNQLIFDTVRLEIITPAAAARNAAANTTGLNPFLVTDTDSLIKSNEGRLAAHARPAGSSKLTEKPSAPKPFNLLSKSPILPGGPLPIQTSHSLDKVSGTKKQRFPSETLSSCTNSNNNTLDYLDINKKSAKPEIETLTENSQESREKNLIHTNNSEPVFDQIKINELTSENEIYPPDSPPDKKKPRSDSLDHMNNKTHPLSLTNMNSLKYQLGFKISSSDDEEDQNLSSGPPTPDFLSNTNNASLLKQILNLGTGSGVFSTGDTGIDRKNEPVSSNSKRSQDITNTCSENLKNTNDLLSSSSHDLKFFSNTTPSHSRSVQMKVLSSLTPNLNLQRGSIPGSSKHISHSSLPNLTKRTTSRSPQSQNNFNNSSLKKSNKNPSGTSTESLANIKNLSHIDRTITGPDGGPRACEQCNTSFSDKFLMINHYSEEHADYYVLHEVRLMEAFNLLKRSPSNKGYLCEICGKHFRDKNHYRYHLAVELDIKPNVCTFCRQAFRVDFRLKKHVKLKHPDQFIVWSKLKGKSHLPQRPGSGGNNSSNNASISIGSGPSVPTASGSTLVSTSLSILNTPDFTSKKEFVINNLSPAPGPSTAGTDYSVSNNINKTIAASNSFKSLTNKNTQRPASPSTLSGTNDSGQLPVDLERLIKLEGLSSTFCNDEDSLQ